MVFDGKYFGETGYCSKTIIADIRHVTKACQKNSKKPHKCPRIVRSILFVNGSKMIQFEKYSFYEQGEHVPISSSFELIAEYSCYENFNGNY